MSASKTTKKKSSSSSSSAVRNRNPFGQSIFPKIVTSTAPGSPPGLNPPVVNTIPMMFNAITSPTVGTSSVTNPSVLTGGGPPSVVHPTVLTKSQKAFLKAEKHEATRQRLIQQLTPPPSHLDELRVMPAAQLAQLSDADLISQALLIMTTANPTGSIVLEDGTRVSIEQILRELSFNATSRGCNAIKAQLRNHKKALSAIALVDRYTSQYGSNQSNSGSVHESISDDDGDYFGPSRSDYGDQFPSISEALTNKD